VFETVLVADHGPVAYRVVRTCQRLGARTVVAHGTTTAAPPACGLPTRPSRWADPRWSDTYGDARKLLEAASRTDAQAVHPGAGPLAEDAALARAVLDAGLVWLGAPPTRWTARSSRWPTWRTGPDWLRAPGRRDAGWS
jgi:acetyl/propionyl-CoA carboxylase alpha subunit